MAEKDSLSAVMNLVSTVRNVNRILVGGMTSITALVRG